MWRKTALSLVGLSVLICSGCSYYKVTDPTSGKVYYTESGKIHRSGFSGAIKLTDAKSGQVVTIQNSEVAKITEAEFKDATGK